MLVGVGAAPTRYSPGVTSSTLAASTLPSAAVSRPAGAPKRMSEASEDDISSEGVPAATT